MKIGIDARLYSQTGIGRYIRNLIKNIAQEDKKNKYYIFLSAGDYKHFKLPNNRWQKIKANIAWHSWSEQLKMPFLLYRYRLDLVHFPYFNVPLLYWKAFLVTLHDLTIWKQATGKASTKALWYFYLKKIAYMIELFYIAKRSKLIITISNTVKKDIVKILGVNNKKVKVIYEAVDLSLHNISTHGMAKKPYLLTVGNFYPHKNLDRLIFAWRKLIKNKKIDSYRLLFAGPRDYFYFRMKKELKRLNLLGKVQFILNPDDNSLANLYRKAECLIFPSLAEGFGLPGLEAMSLSCPVLCSDIPVFREIFGDAPIFFNPLNVDDMVNKIKSIILTNNDLRKNIIKAGILQVNKYSWEKCARKTISLYEDCISL